MIERIMEIMRNKGFNSSRFAEEIGIQRAAMSHILNGRNNVSLDVCKKILEKFPEISIPNIPHGLSEASIGSASIHKATAMKASTRYFRYWSIWSSRTGIIVLGWKNFFEIQKKTPVVCQKSRDTHKKNAPKPQL